jgi:replicative DNA helicase
MHWGLMPEIIDIDRSLVTSTLADGRIGLKRLTDSGITSELLKDPGSKTALDFIRGHTREHGEPPSPEYLQAKTGFKLTDVGDPQTVYIQEVKDRYLWDEQVSFHNDFGKLVNDRKPHDAQSRLDEYQREIRRSAVSPAQAESIWSYAPQVVELYEDAKAGIMGVPTPWPAVNEMTRGFSPGDFIVFAARLGTGKTWSLLQMAHHAHMEGYNVLFISPEMTKAKMAQRVFSLHLQYAYEEVRSGKLGEFKEQAFKERMLELKEREGFNVMGAGTRYTMQMIEDTIAVERPDVVFLDGLYLIRGPGRNRSERAANVADDCKAIAGDMGVPIVASTQFNRDVKENDESTIDIQNIGLSDVIGWNADAAFALYQTADHRTDNEMLIRPLKIREGARLSDVVLRWDFVRMVFSQLAGDQEIDDADYDKYGADPPEKGDGQNASGPSDGGGQGAPDDGVPF